MARHTHPVCCAQVVSDIIRNVEKFTQSSQLKKAHAEGFAKFCNQTLGGSLAVPGPVLQTVLPCFWTGRADIRSTPLGR